MCICFSFSATDQTLITLHNCRKSNFILKTFLINKTVDAKLYHKSINSLEEHSAPNPNHTLYLLSKSKVRVFWTKKTCMSLCG